MQTPPVRNERGTPAYPVPVRNAGGTPAYPVYMKDMTKLLKNIVWCNLNNLLGWHTKRKIVVIESDDWGSIRMPSKEVYDFLLANGYRVNERIFERYDSLANNDDLELLFDVLMGVQDKNNHPAVFTANSIVANPDFDKIKKSNFQEYHYELFDVTLNKYNNHSRAFDLWKEGLSKGLFIPQCHGREHFNIPKWMEALQKGDRDVRFVFDLGMAGIFPKENPQQGNQYLIAYALDCQNDLRFHQHAIEEGLQLFEKIWGFQSRTFITPCYTWHNKINEVLNDKKVELIQGINYQFEPHIARKDKKIFHYSGEKNRLGQRYNVRNCFFEPSTNPNLDWIDTCLSQIQTAFRWNKPAIICSHRVNYIGHIDTSNRDGNLLKLKTLLTKIVNKWTDVEFTSSDKLIDLILN